VVVGMWGGGGDVEGQDRAYRVERRVGELREHCGHVCVAALPSHLAPAHLAPELRRHSKWRHHSCNQFQPCGRCGESLRVTRFLWGAPHSCKQFQPCHSSGESLGVTRFLWGAPHSCKQFQPCHSSGESLGVTRFLWGAPLTSLANWFLTWEPGYPPHLGVDLYLVLNLAATPCRVEDLGDRWEVPPKALSRKVEISTVETAEHKYLLRTPKSSAGLQRGTSRIEPGMPHAIASHVDQKWGFQT